MNDHSGPQTFDEFERECAPMLAPPTAPFVSKFGGRFIHDFAGEKPKRGCWQRDGVLGRKGGKSGLTAPRTGWTGMIACNAKGIARTPKRKGRRHDIALSQRVQRD